jgi:hypothetical protein
VHRLIAAAILAGAVAPLAAEAAGPAVTFSARSSDGRAVLAAERSTSARCRSLTARLRSLAIQETNARDAASRSRGSNDRARAEVRLRRQMLSQAGCNQPMKPGDYRQRRCVELRSRLRMAEQRANSRPVYGATSSAKLTRIRRARQEVRAQYRLSGCPQGRVGSP